MFEFRVPRSCALSAIAVVLLCPGAGADAKPEARVEASEATREPPAAQGHSREAGVPAAENESESAKTRTSFYGWQILAIGGSGGLLAAASTGIPDDPFRDFPSAFGFVVGAPTYLLAGPIVHWTHGYFEKGLASLGGNVAFPLLGGVIGRAVACSSPGCGTNGFGRGAAIGFLIAPILDALLLGWEQIPVEFVGRSGFTLRPYADVRWDRPMVIGLAGQF